MTRQVWLALLALATFGGCAQPTPEQQILDDALAALGGRDAVEAVTALSMEGEGVAGNLGQDMTPEATTQTFTISEGSRQVDLTAERSRVDWTRTPTFNYFRGRDPQGQSFGLDGDIGYDAAPGTDASRVPNAAASIRRADYYRHPLTILRAALDPAATVANARTEGGESLVDITTGRGLEFTLAIDATTKLPTRVTSMANNANLGDVTLTTRFADYEDVDGLMLPTSFTILTDDYRTLEMRASAQSVNEDVGDLAAPGAATSAAPIAGPPPATVEAEEVDDGIWFLAGQSHHSVLVEFSDHLMLIEAPNEVRTLAVIAKARELVPDKPLTHLVNSHHHFDHSGGIRAAVSEELTIVTHAGNASFYESLVERPRTIAPDALAQNPQPLTLETVDDELTHEDDTMTVHLYHVAGNPHADTLLMAYFPRQRILVEADAFSPGRDYQPFAANLLENIEERNLEVERIVPIHGGVVPYDALVSAARPGTS